MVAVSGVVHMTGMARVAPMITVAGVIAVTGMATVTGVAGMATVTGVAGMVTVTGVVGMVTVARVIPMGVLARCRVVMCRVVMLGLVVPRMAEVVLAMGPVPGVFGVVTTGLLGVVGVIRARLMTVVRFGACVHAVKIYPLGVYVKGEAAMTKTKRPRPRNSWSRP